MRNNSQRKTHHQRRFDVRVLRRTSIFFNLKFSNKPYTDTYDLLALSYSKDWRFFIDGDGIDKPYYDLIANGIDAAFLGGINDGDAVPYAPDWISEPDGGTPELFEELAKVYTQGKGNKNACQCIQSWSVSNMTRLAKSCHRLRLVRNYKRYGHFCLYELYC